MARKVENKLKTIDGVKCKLCSTCKEYIPVEQYSNRGASPDGLAYSCKTCERKTAAKSYKSKQARKKSADRYQENKEVYNERAKARYQENKETILVKQADWRRTGKGKKLVNQAAARRRQRMIDQTPGGRDYITEEIIERDSIDGVCICQICKTPIVDVLKDMQIDHITPIAAGGADYKYNVRCTHKLCNISRPKDGSDLEAE